MTNSSLFNTVVEFVSSKADNTTGGGTSSIATSDMLFMPIFVALIVAVISGVAVYLISKKKINLQKYHSSASLFSGNNTTRIVKNYRYAKCMILAVIFAFFAAISLMIPITFAHAQDNVNAEIPEKIQAFVDEDTGEITFEQIQISNMDNKRTIGLGAISTLSKNASLEGKTFVMKAGDTIIYNQAIGSEFALPEFLKIAQL